MPMDIRTYLGIRIHDARKACDLTQQELSDETGVSLKMIQGIEGGSVNPSYKDSFSNRQTPGAYDKRSVQLRAR